MPGKGQEKERIRKKRWQCVKTLQGIPRKQSRWECAVHLEKVARMSLSKASRADMAWEGGVPRARWASLQNPAH